MIFPQALSHIHAMPVVCPLSASCLPHGVYGGPATAAYPTANKAFFVPFVLTAPYTIKTLWWANGTTTTDAPMSAPSSWAYQRSSAKPAFYGKNAFRPRGRK
jgi:hypothetical protein